MIVTETNRKTTEGQGRWASAKPLPYNHEDMSLDPQHSLRKHRHGCAVCCRDPGVDVQVPRSSVRDGSRERSFLKRQVI